MFSSSIFLSLREKNKKNISNNILLHLFTIQEYIFFCIRLYLDTMQERKVQKIGFNKIQIKYLYKGKPYYIFSQVPRGPLSREKKLISIKNGDGKDVTKYIVPFLGPNNDWHNIPYTPNDFNENTLQFLFENNEPVIIKEDESLLSFFS